MQLEDWLAYVAAYAVICIIPGPSVLFVIGQSLSRGTYAALASVLGDVLGGAVVMTASFLGLGLMLAASSGFFSIVKWAGVAYMAYLGCNQILAASRPPTIGHISYPGAKGSVGAGFLNGVLNPKAIIFYTAFLAQFIDPQAPQVPQFIILLFTSAAIVGLILGGYAFLAGRIAHRLRTVTARTNVGYAGGACLLGGCAVMAATR